MEASRNYVDFMDMVTGEILTYAEMLKQFRDEYDGFDDTNLVGLSDMYIAFPVLD